VSRRTARPPVLAALLAAGAAALLAAGVAALVAGCGGSASPVPPRVPQVTALCVYAGDSPALLRGIDAGLSAARGQGGPFRLRVCGTGAREAVTRATTILYVGDATRAQGALTRVMLADAGVPQISPVAVPQLSRADTDLELALTLIPSVTARLDAARLAQQVLGCRVLTPGRSRLPGACWLTAPRNLAADGETAIDLLVAALRHLGHSGDSRSAVMQSLTTQRVNGTPLGLVAFNADGQMIDYTFNLWREGRLGRPQLVAQVTGGPRLSAGR
jgi:hypothetical protein